MGNNWLTLPSFMPIVNVPAFWIPLEPVDLIVPPKMLSVPLAKFWTVARSLVLEVR